MPTRMFGDSPRLVKKSIPAVHRAAAKIDILEPEGEKLLIESTQLLPDVAANHQKRSGRLLDLETPMIVNPQAAVLPVYRVVRPNAIQQQSFQSQSCRCRQLPSHESDLRLADSHPSNCPPAPAVLGNSHASHKGLQVRFSGHASGFNSKTYGHCNTINP